MNKFRVTIFLKHNQSGIDSFSLIVEDVSRKEALLNMDAIMCNQQFYLADGSPAVIVPVENIAFIKVENEEDTCIV